MNRHTKLMLTAWLGGALVLGIGWHLGNAVPVIVGIATMCIPLKPTS